MMINSLGIMAVCCLIMHQDIIRLFWNHRVAPYLISSPHESSGFFPQEHLSLKLPNLYPKEQCTNPEKKLQSQGVVRDTG